jgi:DNA-directed RNA polymerase subunit beta
MTPEEKLLRAIFGEKASDVRDTSLRVPPGVQGTIVEVRVFNRHGVDKDERALAIEREEIERLAKDRDDEQAILDRNVYGRCASCCWKTARASRSEGLQEGHQDHARRARRASAFAVVDVRLAERQADGRDRGDAPQYDESKKGLEQRFLDKVEKLQRGDELPPGVMKMVKVFVAVKRKMQPGDKMAGRHGNKGVVSRIVPIEDMPFLEDGTPVDIVLNPLGVPSRMNVGQILETHLGWACAGLGKQIGETVDAYLAKPPSRTLKPLRRPEEDLRRRRDHQVARTTSELIELGENLRHGVPIATPVFDGAKEADIEEMLKLAGSTRPARSTSMTAAPASLRSQGDGRLHLHAEAAPSRRRQDPRAFDRSVLARHPAAAGRQGAVRRPALRRNGSLGARGLRRRLHAAGNADREVGRRRRPHQGLRGDRARRRHVRGRHPGIFNVLVKEMRRSASTSSCTIPRSAARLDGG